MAIGSQAQNDESIGSLGECVTGLWCLLDAQCAEVQTRESGTCYLFFTHTITRPYNLFIQYRQIRIHSRQSHSGALKARPSKTRKKCGGLSNQRSAEMSEGDSVASTLNPNATPKHLIHSHGTRMLCRRRAVLRWAWPAAEMAAGNVCPSSKSKSR